MSVLDRSVSFLAGMTMTTPKRRRIEPMEVLCLGCPRTGTESLCRALKILGYSNTYHGFEIHNRFSDRVLWNKATMAKFLGVGSFGRHEWDNLLGDCMAVADLPCIAFSSELLEAYPNAKVILTTRPVEDWIKSCRGVIPSPFTLWVLYVLSFFSPKALVATHTFLWHLELYKFSALSDNGLRSRYYEHNAMIRGLLPRDRLLEYHVSQGWEPLCEFLRKSTPEQEMPRGNTVKDFEENEIPRRSLMFRQAMWNAVLLCTALCAVVIATCKAL